MFCFAIDCQGVEAIDCQAECGIPPMDQQIMFEDQALIIL